MSDPPSSFTGADEAHEREIEYALAIQEARRLTELRKRLQAAPGGWDAAAWTLDAGFDDDAELTRRLQLGREARQALVEMNGPLVKSVCRRYRSSLLAARRHGSGLQESDLMQEATIGLIRAAEKFDPTLGYRFSTYATTWIRSMAISTLRRNRIIRLPEEVQVNYRKMIALEAESEEGVALGDDQLAAQLGVSAARVRLFREAGKLHVQSYDAVVSKTEGGLTMLDMIGSSPQGEGAGGEGAAFGEAWHEMNGQAEKLLLRRDLDRLLAQVLVPREQLALKLRYGLDGGGQRSVRDVSELMNLNRNTVTGLCKSAFQKIREVPGAESLIESLNS